MSEKIALVTGAGGFIGSHVVEALVRLGVDVVAMVRYSSSPGRGCLDLLDNDIKTNFKVIAGDITDSDFVFRAVDGMDAVLHLAALIAIPYSYVAPRSYLRTNIEGTMNVLEAARQFTVGRLVNISTSEVYGTAQREPIDESHPLQAQSPYSASKIGAEKIAESYYRSFDTNVVTLRPFNTFGPRQSSRAFIPTIISQALDRDEIHLGALDPMRDLTFVTDTVAGILAAADAEGIAGETINLGTGITYSIGAIAKRILSLMRLEKPVVQDSKRLRPPKSEVLKLISDNSKARSMIRWSPRVSLDEGLELTIEFVRENRHLFKADCYVV